MQSAEKRKNLRRTITYPAFIDLGDKARYTYKVSAAVSTRHRNGLWRISLQEVSVSKMSGVAPYFSTSGASFFQPGGKVLSY